MGGPLHAATARRSATTRLALKLNFVNGISSAAVCSYTRKATSGISTIDQVHRCQYAVPVDPSCHVDHPFLAVHYRDIHGHQG